MDSCKSGINPLIELSATKRIRLFPQNVKLFFKSLNPFWNRKLNQCAYCPIVWASCWTELLWTSIFSLHTSVKLICSCWLKFCPVSYYDYYYLLFGYWNGSQLFVHVNEEMSRVIYGGVTCWLLSVWQRKSAGTAYYVCVCVCIEQCVWPSSREMTPACDWLLQ